MDAEACRSEAQTAKIACCIVSIVYIFVAWFAHSLAPLVYGLMSSTLIQLLFLCWVTSTSNPQIMKGRYSNVEYVTAMNSVVLSGFLGTSPTTLARGVSCCLLPIFALNSCRSRRRAMSYCVLHFSCILYNINFPKFEAHDDMQWLVLSLLAYALAISVQLRAFMLDESGERVKMAYEVFAKMLGVMCDGHLVLDGRGCIVGLDRKAATIISSRSEAGAMPFSSLLHPASNGYNVQARLEKLQLVSADGQCMEVESYTCYCVLNLDSVQLVLGPDCRIFSSAAEGCTHVRALRILNQHPMVQTSVEPTSSNTKHGTCRGSQGQDVNITESVPRCPGVSQSDASEAASVTSTFSKSSDQQVSIGHEVNMVLKTLDEASKQALETDGATVAARKFMSVKKGFTFHLKNLISQTLDQFISIASNSEAPTSVLEVERVTDE